MSISIGLIELIPTHASLVRSWVRLTTELPVSLTVYVSLGLVDGLTRDETSHVDLVSQRRNESVFKFTSRAINDANAKRLDVLVALSAQNTLVALSFARIKTPFWITVHNLNSWFPPHFIPSFGPKVLIRRLLQRRLLAKAKGLIVGSDNLRTSLLERNLASRYPVLVVPFAPIHQVKPTSSVVASEDRPPTIVYPGVVAYDRKRYEVFLSLAKIFSEMNFVFLGKDYSGALAKKVKEYSLNSTSSNVVFFESYVPPEEFHKWLGRASLLFTDFRDNVRIMGALEQYGRTKDAGISHLMVAHGLPALVSANFKNLDILKGATLYFSTVEEATHHLNSLFYDGQLSLYKDAAMRAAKDFQRQETSVSSREAFLRQLLGK